MSERAPVIVHRGPGASSLRRRSHGSSIVAVAEVFDALTTSRPCKQAWAFEAGLANLREEAGKLYDAECVEAFLSNQDAVREVAASISH